MPEQKYMQLALELAARAEGLTRPNPPVGAVLVVDGRIVGQGFHPGAGQPHAEVLAIQDAGTKASGATLYVTLEPCNHQGRTGPCTEAVIAAGIKNVIVGTLDPNPLVAGKGVDRLKNAGIEVSVGLMETACRRLIAPFAKHIKTGLPYVTLKMAMTLDGQTATADGDSQWISNEQSRHHVHQMRNVSDAIMVGVGTVLADDPQLTTRLPHNGKDPVRIIVDSNLKIPETARVFNPDSAAQVILLTTPRADAGKITALQNIGAEVVVVPERNGRVDLRAAMQELGRRDIQSVLLEGGATVAAEALKCGIVDRMAIFIAPKLLVGNDGKCLFNGSGCKLMKDALQLKAVTVRQFADDILVEGEVS
ncbi:MAG: bifunctional diaminohydroxyphosphoribosylaminopyrimidine deaminase/5-amino-6-(5-phosphoribosylamino)uracil reductase RibD [Desulfuromonas sp.]|nr:MAG: bifunctional diaminohydroxyphosphoribosylaminopyrimidine deaminase/5-amino-6-(5-phosphoribosylamino)uracil reductase RibD [Desulfuromonas sp.]